MTLTQVPAEDELLPFPEDPWPADSPARPRKITARYPFSDRVFVIASRGTGFITLLIVSAIGLFLGLQFVPTLRRYGWSFFTEPRWLVNQDILGIAAAVVGTIEVATIALVIAFPLALFSALFISDWAPPQLRAALVRTVDLMAAVPSIVFGLWGLFLIQPHAAHIAHFLSKYFGWIPLFHVHTDVNYPVWDQRPATASTPARRSSPRSRCR